jgi:hypothetical protein
MALPADAVIAALRSGACPRISGADLAPNAIQISVTVAENGGTNAHVLHATDQRRAGHRYRAC